MFINFTIIIQACNFFIAYKVMSKLLFKPAFAALQEERSGTENLQLHINAIQVILCNQTQEKEVAWRTFQQEFIRHTPNAQQEELYILKDIAPEIHVDNLPQTHMQKLEQEVTQSIIKGIEQSHA